MELPDVNLSSALTMVLGIIGFVSPLVLSAVIQTGWSAKLQSYVTLAYSVLVGALLAWASGSLTAPDIVTNVLVVFTFTIAFYRGFWKTTGVSKAIEERTNITPKE